jgi:hypothetical protein
MLKTTRQGDLLAAHVTFFFSFVLNDISVEYDGHLSALLTVGMHAHNQLV